MKCFLITTINILLAGLSSPYITPPMVTKKYMEPDILEMNSNTSMSNDTLIFAQVVSITRALALYFSKKTCSKLFLFYIFEI